MKKTLKLLTVCIFVLSFFNLVQAQEEFPYNLTWTTNPGDTAYGFSGEGINNVINNKCGLKAGFDFDNDGNLEFITSLQSTNEVPKDNILYWFEADGDNNYSLRWAFKVENVQHQRNALAVADLDNNGNPEIIWIVDRLTENVDNVFFFEFDPNSGNFPDQPTATWNTPRDGDGEFRCEVDFKVFDIDKDGVQEMIFISFDGLVIASLTSADFTNPSFNAEYTNFSEMTWLFASTITDLDNSGTYELITLGGWGAGGFNILEAIAADFYILAVNEGIAEVPGGCYNAMTAADLDENGFPEIYYADTNGNFRSIITNGPYNTIDQTNFHLLGTAGSEVLTVISEDSSFYVATSAASEIVKIDYLGGDVSDSTNFQFIEIYADTLTGTESITIFRMDGLVDLDGDDQKDIVFAAANHGESRPTLYVIEDQNITSVELLKNSPIPTDFTLEQNYPNPFNPVTTITFNLPKQKRISLIIYNMMGQEITTLISNEIYQPGRHQLTWDATDHFGNQVSSGVYIYKLIAEYFIASKTMNFIR